MFFFWPIHQNPLLTNGTFQITTAPSALPVTINLPHGLNLQETILAACATPVQS